MGPVSVWANDRLLVWANAKADPTPDGKGYGILPTQAGWAWGPPA